MQQHSVDTTTLASPVVIGLDGGYMRNRPGGEGRHFEVIAGKVIDVEGTQHRFAFVRNGPVAASNAFQQALDAAGVNADTPATVLCDGNAGLWRLQRAALPDATIVSDWWHLAVRFEHALQAARRLGAGPAEKHLADQAVRGLERAKWCLWHGRWPGCRRKLAALCRRTQRQHLSDVAGIGGLQRHARALFGSLERNQDALVHSVARRADLDGVCGKCGQRDRRQAHEQEAADALEPDDGAAFLDVRTAVLNGMLESVFRQH